MAGALELASMDSQELEQRLAESRQELFNLRFQLATGQLDNTARLGHVRKDVARILTVLRQRELEELEDLAAQVGAVAPAGLVTPAEGLEPIADESVEEDLAAGEDVDEAEGATGDLGATGGADAVEGEPENPGDSEEEG